MGIPTSTRHHTVHRTDTGGGRLVQWELESELNMTILSVTWVKIRIYAVPGSCRLAWHTKLRRSDVFTSLSSSFQSTKAIYLLQMLALTRSFGAAVHEHVELRGMLVALVRILRMHF